VLISSGNWNDTGNFGRHFTSQFVGQRGAVRDAGSKNVVDISDGTHLYQQSGNISDIVKAIGTGISRNAIVTSGPPASVPGPDI
jgi:hypothetical protein